MGDPKESQPHIFLMLKILIHLMVNWSNPSYDPAHWKFPPLKVLIVVSPVLTH